MNIAVVGGSQCTKRIYRLAYRMGEMIAQQGWVLICGGGGGVMEAACQGARNHAGRTVGILPERTGDKANAFLDIALPTGLGYARNILVVRAAEAVVAIDGKYGTLSEIAFALNEGKWVFGLYTWDVKGVICLATPEQVIARIKKYCCKEE